METYRRAIQGSQREPLDTAEAPSSRLAAASSPNIKHGSQVFVLTSLVSSLHGNSRKRHWLQQMLWCSDSSPEKPDTYLNVESSGLPTDAETTGLVTGMDKAKLLGGLEPSPELVAIAMGTPACFASMTCCRALTLWPSLMNRNRLGTCFKTHVMPTSGSFEWHAERHVMQLYNHRALLAVYFVQGILGLSRLGVSFMYKDEFHLEPASVRPPAASPWL